MLCVESDLKFKRWRALCANIRNLGLVIFLGFTFPLIAQDIPDRSAATADLIFTGLQEFELMGNSMDVGFDLDRDGLEDFAIGAPAGGKRCFENPPVPFKFCDGAVFLFGGKRANLIKRLEGPINQNPDSTNNFGSAVRLADLNGDGLAEVIVGSSYSDARGYHSGNVNVYSGTDYKILSQFYCDSKVSDECGRSIATGCDLDSDGSSEILVGAHTGVYIYSGRSSAFLGKISSVQGSADDWAKNIRCDGDFTGDGKSDVLVAAPLEDVNGSGSGAVYGYDGNDFQNRILLRGDVAGDQFGRGLSFVGDVNRDGFDDFAVGADQQSDRGYVRLYSGRDLSILSEWKSYENCGSTGANCNFGASLSSAGDQNGNGIADLLISDPTYNAGQGRLYLVSLADSQFIQTITGESPSSDAFSVPCRGLSSNFDANGDGQSDILCAAPFHDSGGTDTGRAYLFLSYVPEQAPPPASDDEDLRICLDDLSTSREELVSLQAQVLLLQDQNSEQANHIVEYQARIIRLERKIEQILSQLKNPEGNGSKFGKSIWSKLFDLIYF
ncbi:MAG: hypothetical protein COV44_08235 [Deltaproteobacteria bacterium CG11_big_fil_rev_8_21_14_0_20_45_16]|nr:MAG: hypothetical protein COV44_08235 [Deltaproteobacteria bacterium CG11_big_fil_rev_8_21_14_0_20_45_16]